MNKIKILTKHAYRAIKKNDNMQEFHVYEGTIRNNFLHIVATDIDSVNKIKKEFCSFFWFIYKYKYIIA